MGSKAKSFNNGFYKRRFSLIVFDGFSDSDRVFLKWLF